MKLKFTHQSIRDLERLNEFIRIKNPSAAKRVSDELRKSISRLVDQPRLGKILEEIEKPETREWFAGDYVVRYVATSEHVVILKIWHGKEDR